MTRRLCIPALLALAAGLGAAGTALGEGEEEGWSFHPGIRTVLVYDDEANLGKPGQSNEGDVGFWIKPNVEVGYKTPDLDLGADVGLDLRRYITRDALADELIYANAFVEAGLLPGLSVRLENDLAPQYRQLGLPEEHGANLIQANRTDAGLRYWRELGGNTELEIGGTGTYFLSERFTAGFPSAGGPTFDPNYRATFWQATGIADLHRPLGRSLSGHLATQAGYRDYADGARADHTNLAMTLGLESERFETLELVLEAGYGAILFDGLGTVHQPLGKLSLRHQLPRGFHWSALLANRFRSNLVGNEVFESAAELGLGKQLGERADASVQGFVARFEDRGAPADFYWGVETELGFDLTRQARLALTYRHWRNTGDAGFDDMAQNAVFASFQFRH